MDFEIHYACATFLPVSGFFLTKTGQLIATHFSGSVDFSILDVISLVGSPLDSVQFGSISLNPIYSDFMLSLIQCTHCRNQSNPPSTVPCHAQVIHLMNSWPVEQQEAECIEGDRRESLCLM